MAITATGCASGGRADLGAQERLQTYDSRRLEEVFNRCFLLSENTQLVGGVEEPLYRPAKDEQDQHLLYYREDYFASALHEVAHWCIAGRSRRQLVDFGYWYAPEGRDSQQQRAFESVEVKPQALEWYFAKACGYRFQVSVDNLDPETGALPDTGHFRERVLAQARYWLDAGLPPRAQLFFEALSESFGTRLMAACLDFQPEELL